MPPSDRILHIQTGMYALQECIQECLLSHLFFLPLRCNSLSFLSSRVDCLYNLAEIYFLRVIFDIFKKSPDIGISVLTFDSSHFSALKQLNEAKGFFEENVTKKCPGQYSCKGVSSRRQSEIRSSLSMLIVLG